MAISMLKIRRPLGRLIFNMGIAIPGKTVFLIETAPRVIRSIILSPIYYKLWLILVITHAIIFLQNTKIFHISPMRPRGDFLYRKSDLFLSPCHFYSLYINILICDPCFIREYPPICMEIFIIMNRWGVLCGLEVILSFLCDIYY